MTAPLATLPHPVSGSQEIKKSRFDTRAAPIASPAEALAFLDQIADRQATHNCWAYRLGQQYRFSDDGEPGGTAGKPILQAIEGQGFDRVMVVVTRYYGGIKLGAGGLVRAYGGSAAECLRAAPRVPIVLKTEVEFDLPFAALSLVQARLSELDADRLADTFDGDGVRLRLALPADRVEHLRRLLADATRGRSVLRVLN
ncbi:IMPACT family protein [Tahibacter amnicola]|uniref:IMPACT family protein n=1 Tax=Tahibacter amnicola TaxID=2976241 RepID=A0ABY6BN42_9GAMM|nr:YigZ family protein [Tahibacter amnicola]UXI69986.1 IMPACT family protein [Tahibacter amnicola]